MLFRSVVLMHDLAQIPYGEVAAVLGITAGTARVYRRKAIIQLAQWLQDNEVSP